LDTLKPTVQSTSAGARILDNIGSNNGLGIIIEDHFKQNPGAASSQSVKPIISDDKRSEGTRAIDKKNVGHIQSLEKMEIMQKLDRYLTT
jgi:hypothetical protein